MRFAIRLGLATLCVLAVGGIALAGLSAGRDKAVKQGDGVAPVKPLSARLSTDQQIADLQARISRTPANARLQISLAAAYLQKTRESGDPSLYGRAEAVLTRARELDPEDADAWVQLGTLALARHQFEQALGFGGRAQELNPSKTAALGVIGDAQVELGRYDEATATFQAMVDLRPDLASYARVSYIRELYGDMPGAIAAMRQGVTGASSSEAHAWTQVQLGHLYFNSGDLAGAKKEYERTLFQRPDYLHAKAGLARITAARGDYATAAALYEPITKAMPLPEYVIALADVHHAAGNNQAAAEAEALVQVMDRLFRENSVNTDVEMALFFADHDLDPVGTVERARAAIAIRPSIHAYDALAWALYKAGRYDEALAASDQALRLGTRDSLMRYHAGMIAIKLGLTGRARDELRAAVTQNPHFSVRYGEEAERMLREIDPTALPPRIAGQRNVPP